MFVTMRVCVLLNILALTSISFFAFKTVQDTKIYFQFVNQTETIYVTQQVNHTETIYVEVEVEKPQTIRNGVLLCNTQYTSDTIDDTQANGYCFLGKLFCKVGWIGENCDIPDNVTPCESDIHDICYNHPINGVAAVPRSRWLIANRLEAETWKGNGDTNDRAAEHVNAFGNYDSIKNVQSFGKMIEIGCGPWTQTQFVIKSHSNPVVDNIMLVDPNIINYIRDTPHCSYKTGSLLGYPTHFLVAGGEEATWVEEFDTIVMINVLEHTYNAYNILGNLWRVLKPGGLLIFHERWHDNRLDDTRYWGLGDNGDMQPIDVGKAFHPIRVRKPVIDHFLDHFDIMYITTTTPQMIARQELGVYAIGRKR